MDVASMVGAVTRVVKTVERDGKPARVVIAERDYPTDIEDLWNALTDKARIPRWFLPIDGDLELGGRYQFTGNAGGEIIACEPPRSFTVTWEFGGGVSWVTVMLAAKGAETTALTLEHSAHITDEAEVFWTQYGPGATGVGWDLGLMGLALHVASGESTVMGPEAESQWAASDEGRAYITGAADGWVAAAIADGDDPQAARAAGQNTKGFYTGEPPSQS